MGFARATPVDDILSTATEDFSSLIVTQLCFDLIRFDQTYDRETRITAIHSS
jgi:hypothetical protein